MTPEPSSQARTPERSDASTEFEATQSHAEPRLGVRAQLLAAEHWSLLSTRSMAQSEVLTRITTFLTLVSASIVSLALIGQATRFDQRFLIFALVLFGLVVVTGILTQIRVGHQSIEDLAHVIGMNRLRAAYVQLDATVKRYLVTSYQDDDRGLWQTYNHLLGPTSKTAPLGSSGAFIIFVNAGLTGAFAALVALALNAPAWAVGVVSAVAGLFFLTASLAVYRRQYKRMRERYVPLFPGPDAGCRE
jgi:FtsH-binding integral membrane protein